MSGSFLRSLFATLLLVSSAAADRARPPNLIFVLSDDVAQGDLGCYGQQLIQTPRLDQMAAEGTRYMQFYCGTSVCAPSRSSFMTGLHSGHCPVRGNYEVPPEGQLPLPDETVTIAEVAKTSRLCDGDFRQVGHGILRHQRQSAETRSRPFLWLQLPTSCAFLFSNLPV